MVQISSKNICCEKNKIILGSYYIQQNGVGTSLDKVETLILESKLIPQKDNPKFITQNGLLRELFIEPFIQTSAISSTVKTHGF